MNVAVVTPVYRPQLQPEELISLRHLNHYLGAYEWHQISPASLDFRLDRFIERKFRDADFKSLDSYSRLLLSRRFYEAFADYEYILIYQLDSLVFRDELKCWCQQGFDYIGAPLFRVKGDVSSGFSGACNGGFSLRKVSSFLNVLNSKRYVEEEVPFLMDVFHKPFVEVRPSSVLRRWQKRVTVARAVRRGVDVYAGNCSLNEDHFWSGRSSYFEPEFRVASPEMALRFAFEAGPSHCFQLNGKQLPFGAHAWKRYEPAFWSHYLLEK